MSDKKTHTHHNKPRMTVRHLADFMVASDTARRTIVRECKFALRVRMIHHSEARRTVGMFIRDIDADIARLDEEAQRLRDKLADPGYERDLLDHNADYIARFAKVWPKMTLPKAEILPPGASKPIDVEGVSVAVDLQFRLRRLTKTNKVRIGAGMLRYGKNETLPPAVGAWQSAFLFGHLRDNKPEDHSDPEHALCVTIDGWGGVAHSAPTDSVMRYKRMRSACATISEWWPGIKPPTGAIY